MIRGFLGGILSGALVSAVGLAVASQLAGPPRPAPVAAQPAPVTQPEPAREAPAAATQPAPATGTPAPVASAAPPVAPSPEAAPAAGPALPGPETAPASDLAQEVAKPDAADPAATAPLADTVPAGRPAVGAGIAAPDAPGAEAAPPAVAPAGPDTAPAAPAPPAPASAAPAEAPPEADTASAAPPDLPGPGVGAAPEGTTAPAPGMAPAVPGPGMTPLPPPGPPGAVIAAAPEAESRPVLPEPPPAPVVTPPVRSPSLPTITGLPQAAGAPAPGLGGGAAGVMTGRLPEVGADPAPDAAPAAAGPFRKNATHFSDHSGKPLFAVILTDTGLSEAERKALAGLALPVAVAVDPTAPDAGAAAAEYRKGGHEVLALATAIPPRATVSDLAVTIQGYETAVPDALGILDLASGGFQTNRGLSQQIVDLVGQAGLGLVTYDRGLNAADQLARAGKIPAAAIFRMLDAQGENAATIGRYLDRAAFKAQQDGAVVVIGSARAETLMALSNWATGERAQTVVLAPVSAVMKAAAR